MIRVEVRLRSGSRLIKNHSSKISLMILSSPFYSCHLLSIHSYLFILLSIRSVQSPLTARAFTDPELCRARRSLENEAGSPLTLLELFGAWLEEKSSGGASASRRWCRKLGLEEQRLYEMTKLRSQFRQLLEEHKLTRKSLEEEEESGGGQKALDRCVGS